MTSLLERIRVAVISVLRYEEQPGADEAAEETRRHGWEEPV
jgi:hypothetical protein